MQIADIVEYKLDPVKSVPTLSLKTTGAAAYRREATSIDFLPSPVTMSADPFQLCFATWQTQTALLRSRKVWKELIERGPTWQHRVTGSAPGPNGPSDLLQHFGQ